MKALEKLYKKVAGITLGKWNGLPMDQQDVRVVFHYCIYYICPCFVVSDT